MLNVDDFQQVQPEWSHHRIIHSKYPPRNIFDDDDGENYALGEMMADTSERLLTPHWFVEAADIRTGDGWGAVMASFCYPGYGRYSTDQAGAYYAANDAHTAIAEWTFHTGREWARFGYTSEVSAVVRGYKGKIALPILDVREAAEFHISDSYESTQKFSSAARAMGANGVLYRSVRSEGECVALFRPPATTKVTQAAHYVCTFDGRAFTSFAKIGELTKI